MPTIDRISPNGHGHFRVTITFRGKQYSATTTNTMAIDTYRSEDDEDRSNRNYSKKEGEKSLIWEVKTANDPK